MGAIVSSIGNAKSMQALSKLSTAMENPETETGQAAAQLAKDVGDRMLLASQRATAGLKLVTGIGYDPRSEDQIRKDSGKKKKEKDPFNE